MTRTVQRILDILKERNLLLERGSTEASPEAEKKPLDSRARVVKELVDTERKYVQDLEILQEYMRCLEREEIVSKDLIHNLFLNLNQLVDFQRRFLIRVETQNDLQPEQQNWGNLFVQYVRFSQDAEVSALRRSSNVYRKNHLLCMNHTLPTFTVPSFWLRSRENN